jgi:hypothetical protein
VRLLRREPSARGVRLERARRTRGLRGRHGWAVVSVGLLVPVAAVASVLLVSAGGGGSFSGGALAGLAGALTVTLTAAVVTLGRRLKSQTLESILERDKRPPVVYLRPFKTDQQRASPLARKRYEQVLARPFRKVGPFVAVGDPTERLPQLGAARTYADDVEWTDTVADLTARAGVIVLQAGQSEGLGWEIEHVLGLHQPERVLVALPVQGSRGEPTREEAYNAFRRAFGHLFPRPLPPTIGTSRVLSFEADWTPRLHGHRGSSRVEAVPGSPGERRARALRALDWEFGRLRVLLWIKAAALVFLVIVIVLLFVMASEGTR